MSEHISADQLDRYADAATAQLRAERDDARRQMQSLTEDYVAMEARAVAAEAMVREQAEQLDTLRNGRVEAVKAWEQMKAPLGAAEPFMRLDRIMRDWAAAAGGVPEEGRDG